VSAVLEHEAIAGLSAGKPTGLRSRAHRGSVSEDRNKDMSLDMLIKAVCNWCLVFSSYLPAVKLLCYCFARIISVCKAGLLLNSDKTKTMVCGSNMIEKKISEETDVENVERFAYFTLIARKKFLFK